MAAKLAAGNWKMNGSRAALSELDGIAARAAETGCPTLICPPFVLIDAAHQYLQEAGHAGSVLIGAQDCHWAEKGAHTGDVSAPMLRELGCTHVILGHSERRADHGETSAEVSRKAVAAHEAGLVAVICVGETEAQRDNGDTLAVIAKQIAESVPDCATAANTVVAYEPVWAIGTGRVPSAEQIAEVHARLRADLDQRFADGAAFTLLYGGSVKGSNAAEIFGIEHVNGALVGGASLTAADFTPIISALASA